MLHKSNVMHPTSKSPLPLEALIFSFHMHHSHLKIEGAMWEHASVECGGGEVEKKMRHRCSGLTHNSELGFESLLLFIV